MTDERPEAIIAKSCFVSRTRLLERTVSAIYAEELGPLGLAPPRLGLLAAVASYGAAPASVIAKQLGLEKSTMSRDLSALRDLGWLEQRPGADARSSLVVLTAAGRKMLRTGLPAWQRAQARTQALLGESAAKSLVAMANHLRSAI